jgi:alpha-glucosidase
MQWTPGRTGGFTTAEPWLPLADDTAEVNAEAQRADPSSMLHLYRDLIALRRREAALAIGNLDRIEAVGLALVYTRSFAGRRLLVALNFGHVRQDLPLAPGTSGRVLLSAGRGREGEPITRTLALGADDAVIVALDPA